MTTASQVARLFYEVQENPRQEPEEQRIVSTRMPVSLLRIIDAMAVEAGVSRNTMALRLLEVGIGEVMAELPDSVRECLFPAFADPHGIFCDPQGSA